jgi:hypothetical protein
MDLSHSLCILQLPTDINTFEQHIAGTNFASFIQFGQPQCTFAYPGLLLEVTAELTMVAMLTCHHAGLPSLTLPLTRGVQRLRSRARGYDGLLLRESGKDLAAQLDADRRRRLYGLLRLFIVFLSGLTRPPHQRSSSTCRLALVRGGRSASTTTRTWWERTSCGAPSAGVLACPHAVIAHYTNLALTGVCLRSGPGVVVDRKATAHETPGSDAVQNVELVSAESTCTALAHAHIVQCRGILATHFLSRAGWCRCEWMVHVPAPAQAEHGRRAGRQCDRWRFPGAALTAITLSGVLASAVR